jgi:hypothetical protein
MRYLNRWTASCAWMAAMVIGWLVFGPRAMSPSTWLYVALGGSVMLVGGAMLWESTRPTPSYRQTQAVTAARDAATAEARR